MSIDVTVKIGGEAGQGIQTVGQLLSLTAQQAGFYIMGINDFESRIRGGHSFFQIRISDTPVAAPHHQVHLLIAMDDRTRSLHQNQVVGNGITIINDNAAAGTDNTIAVPFVDLAEEAGGSITANTVAAGSALSLLGAPFEMFEAVLKEQFQDKSQKAVDLNLTAAKRGYEAVHNIGFSYSFDWQDGSGKGMLIDGAQSLALGALAGDCRFASFYPMSPATSIMINLASFQDTFPLVVEQAEDEISAANMIIGASYAGVRSITSTSGGGFCLMAEALGYAGIAEVPIVIINAQRPGPATGMATRTAQGDLLFTINAAQDDFPLFVFAPGSPAEAFETTARAFELAEKYQAPAVILVDQYFNDSLYILEKRLSAPDAIQRFILEHTEIQNPSEYKRYAVTESGVSPMTLPCAGPALVMTSGNEHSPDGHLSETVHDRVVMVDKRARKQQHMREDMKPPSTFHPEASVLVIGWGSTAGIIKEAVVLLRNDGIDAGCVHFCDIWPFPTHNALQALGDTAKICTVELNSTGQFSRLLRQETGRTVSHTILKYDGRPIYPIEIVNNIKKIME